jgi:hypothetical protein
MSELDYGPVFVAGGRYKGRILYYDDDDTAKTTICYVGHPLSFAGSYAVPLRFLREPTIDDLIKRSEELWRTLIHFPMEDDWNIHSSDLYALWAEKSLIDETLFERRMFGELGKLDSSNEVFLCHCSIDKGTVRMVHDDLKHLGVSCWLDENKIKVGDSIVSKISEGLTSSQTMILFLSKHPVKSMWARKEWQSFLARQLAEDALRILPVLLEECEIPAILSDIKYADFRKSYLEGFKQIHGALSDPD